MLHCLYCTILYCNIHYYTVLYYDIPGYVVAQSVEALRYKPEGRGFDSRYCSAHVFLFLFIKLVINCETITL